MRRAGADCPHRDQERRGDSSRGVTRWSRSACRSPVRALATSPSDSRSLRAGSPHILFLSSQWLSNEELVERGTSLIVADRASGLTIWPTILAANRRYLER